MPCRSLYWFSFDYVSLAPLLLEQWLLRKLWRSIIYLFLLFAVLSLALMSGDNWPFSQLAWFICDSELFWSGCVLMIAVHRRLSSCVTASITGGLGYLDWAVSALRSVCEPRWLNIGFYSCSWAHDPDEAEYGMARIPCHLNQMMNWSDFVIDTNRLKFIARLNVWT